MIEHVVTKVQITFRPTPSSKVWGQFCVWKFVKFLVAWTEGGVVTGKDDEGGKRPRDQTHGAGQTTAEQSTNASHYDHVNLSGRHVGLDQIWLWLFQIYSWNSENCAICKFTDGVSCMYIVPWDEIR